MEGEGVGGGGGSDTHTVEDARLVSSSFNLPSKARLVFSLLSDSEGVIDSDFSKVELASTVSLQDKGGT